MMNERQASKPLGTGIWGLHDSKPLQSLGMADGRQRLGYGTFVQTMKPVNDRTKQKGYDSVEAEEGHGSDNVRRLQNTK